MRGLTTGNVPSPARCGRGRGARRSTWVIDVAELVWEPLGEEAELARVSADGRPTTADTSET
jgi:hypothetical protein